MFVTSQGALLRAEQTYCDSDKSLHACAILVEQLYLSAQVPECIMTCTGVDAAKIHIGTSISSVCVPCTGCKLHQ